jgi:hypothetical protein
MNVMVVIGVVFIYPFIFKADFYFEGLWKNKVIEDKGGACNEKCTDDIGTQDSSETCSTTEDCNKFSLLRHLTCEKDDRNKNKEGREKVAVVGNEH